MEEQAKELGVSKSDLLVQLFKAAQDKHFQARIIARSRFPLSAEEVTNICVKYHIKTFSLFGSILTKKFNTESDIDILIEFCEDKTPSLFTLSQFEMELEKKIPGRKIDVKTPQELSSYFREQVQREAEVLYAA
ncbi:MAG: nucleotidyltransferase [Deltaproteobacteria bacterium CG_4_10_14_0_2_um_filter_43_8]|nr:MAG: nucleotidyltransferase [Deltaproteobacteria bacterium CG11_big_fil_rev_8_21_14_0_20_42_23]PJA22156.1 MAG: nucleotidyltransferase [Deltaproteobacteria bacterium CG_4_10_14_0_2_um_filter_43_8]PJC65143.1 MAG: nucleotidyltransferase [Deltaproteobacteria bacterium CG_4_9_14_0_2_um_filter_42_21]